MENNTLNPISKNKQRLEVIKEKSKLVKEKSKFRFAIVKEKGKLTLKIGGHIINLTYPHFLALSSIIVFFGLALNRWPLHLDKDTSQFYEKKTITFDQETEVDSETSTKHDLNNILIVTDWKQLPDGRYRRDFINYTIGDFTEEEVKERLKSNIPFEPVRWGKNINPQYKYSLTELDLKYNTPTQIVTIYDKKGNEFIIREEKLDEEIFLSFWTLIISYLSSGAIIACRDIDDKDKKIISKMKEALNQYKENKTNLQNQYKLKR